MLPFKDFYYFIAKANNETLTYDFANSAIVVNPAGTPQPLHDNPIGWNDIKISFGTNNKYFSLNRSFSVPLKFVNDGAAILRDVEYNTGYETELSVVIVSWNPLTGEHNLEYKGKLDFSKFKDEPTTGVTINTIEGGLLSYLNANEAVTYELQCNPTNVNSDSIYFDGIELFDKLNFGFFEYDSAAPGLNSATVYPAPIVYFNNEGDSVGITKGDQSPEEITNDILDAASVDAYVANSSNYFFKTFIPIPAFRVQGEIIVQNTSGNSTGQSYQIVIRTSNGTAYDAATGLPYNSGTAVILAQGETRSFVFDFTFSLAADEKVFIIFYNSGFVDIQAHWNVTNFNASFKTINKPSITSCLKPLVAFQDLVSKMTDGKYTAASNFFSTHDNIVLTSGEALREFKGANGFPNGVIKTSFLDFFNSYNAIYNLGVKVVNNVLYIEPKADLYNDTSQIFDLGEVDDLSISVANEYLINSLKIGYPAQQYDERNGRYEFNCTHEYKLPTTQKKELNLVSKYRGDLYGADFIRGKLNNKETTDNKGDNEVFLINVEHRTQSTFGFFQVNYTSPTVLTFVGYASEVALFTTGKPFRLHYFDLINYFDFFYTVVSTSISGSDLIVTVDKTYTLPASGSTGYYTLFPSILKRVTYTTITGVPTPTVGNIEEMTPARMVKAHGNYLGAILSQLTGVIDFQTADRNKDLYTDDGTTVFDEDADIALSSLPSPLFLPLEIAFKTKVPLSFSSILSNLQAGNIKIKSKNIQLYCLAIGDMDAKPVNKEAQEWKLLASPLNSYADLLALSFSGIYINNNMAAKLFYSDLNPVHMVAYDYQLPAQYHYKDVYKETFENRQGRYDGTQYYFQKWQTTDTIKFQIIYDIGTDNADPDLNIYDKDGHFFNSAPFSFIADPAIQAPFQLMQVDLPAAIFPEGNYQFTIVGHLAGGDKTFLISEWQEVRTSLPETALIRYYNTTNKLNGYFNQWQPYLRVETQWFIPTPESESTEYLDEPGDAEILDGTAYLKQKVAFGDGYGIPDYLMNKLNNIFLLNRVQLEGIQFTKAGDAKMETVAFLPRFPMDYYTIELRKSVNPTGTTVDESGAILGGRQAQITLSADAFGAPITITVDDE